MKTKTKTAPVSALKTIEEVYFNGSQSVEFKGIYNIDGLKLKVEIDRDSYDSQSHAYISVWQAANLQWSQVASLHHSEMAVCARHPQRDFELVFYQMKVRDMGLVERNAFQADKDALIKLAKQILF